MPTYQEISCSAKLQLRGACYPWPVLAVHAEQAHPFLAMRQVDNVDLRAAISGCQGAHSF